MITTEDLGLQVHECTYRREYRLYDVHGLRGGLRVMIIDDSGVFTVAFMDVAAEATARRHQSLESALDEIREYEGLNT